MQNSGSRRWRFAMATARNLLMVISLSLGGSPLGHAAERYLDAIDKLSLGMTAAQVVALLGEPVDRMAPEKLGLDGEAWFYRLSVLANRSGEAARADSADTLMRLGRFRCLLKDGVLTRISGIWPKPKRPPGTVVRSKILLVDVPKIYDGLSMTAKMNEQLTKREKEAQQQLDEINAAGKRLLKEHESVLQQLKHFKGPAEEKGALGRRRDALLGDIQKKDAEAQAFILGTTARLQHTLQRFRDLALPALADAILLFKAERGYEHVFELKQNVLSPGTKPLFVAGVDESEAIVKWIDSGAAKGLGF